MYFMYMTATVTGDDFYPSKVIRQLDTPLVVDTGCTFNKGTSNSRLDKPWTYGSLEMLHRLQYSHEDSMQAYEELFVQFFERNDALLKQHGATDYQIFMHFYYCLQGNFEIFDKYKLARLAKYNVSLPLSVHELDKDEYILDVQATHKAYQLSGEPESIGHID